MKELKKSTIIECVSSTQDRDSQGETLNLEGADISPMLENKAYINSDHSNRFEHLIGRVIDAKKIFKADDCETVYQTKAWERLRRPFLASKVELWDGHGHKEADAVASIYSHYMEKGEEPPIKISVEGKVLERDPKNKSILKRTLIKGLALTIQPANANTMTEVVGIAKSHGVTSDLFKSDGRNFHEVTDNPLVKLHQLAVVAVQLLKTAVQQRAVKQTPNNGKKKEK